MKIPRFNLPRRRTRPPTVRSLGAEVFAEHADGMLAETRRLLEAVARGQILPASPEDGPSYSGLVRQHRDSLRQKLDEDLVLLELMERVERAAVLKALYERHPDLLAAVGATYGPAGALAVRDDEPEPTEQEVRA